MATSNKQPEQTFRIGLVSAAVFVNEIETGGQKKDSKEIRSVTFQRRYKDRESDEWKTGTSYGLADLLILRQVIDLAVKYVEAKEACGN